MTNTPCFWLLVCILLLAPLATVQASATREDIVFLQADGLHYTVYKTLRSDLPGRYLDLVGTSPGSYLFIQPDDYKKVQHNGNTLLRFGGGSYALMDSGKFTGQQVTRAANGVYTFHSWDGQKKQGAHFGKWNTPSDFSAFTYAWLLPDNISIVSYSSNRGGNWTQADGALIWQGKNVNDITFSIRYRVAPATNAATTTAAAQTDHDNTQAANVIMDTALLFPSGRSQLGTLGQKRLAQIATVITHSQPEKIIIKGYTDNQPLKAYLRKKFPSNWALSAARAAGVARWLTDHGVNPSIMEIRAYGPTTSATSTSKKQRARNRRVEIQVMGSN